MDRMSVLQDMAYALISYEGHSNRVWLSNEVH